MGAYGLGSASEPLADTGASTGIGNEIFVGSPSLHPPEHQLCTRPARIEPEQRRYV